MERFGERRGRPEGNPAPLGAAAGVERVMAQIAELARGGDAWTGPGSERAAWLEGRRK